MTRLRASWEYLRGTYWALPSSMAVVAIILSIGMVQLDEAVTATLLNRLSWVYTGGPEGARAVLSTIAGSMITVAGVTFSITIVALTLVPAVRPAFAAQLPARSGQPDRPGHIRVHLPLLPPGAAHDPRHR